METLRNRVERLEEKKRFRHWLRLERFLESFTKEQLDTYASYGQLPDPLPEPLPKGASRLDRLDTKALIKLWQERERMFAGRSHEELKCFAVHGYWPEEAGREKVNVS